MKKNTIVMIAIAFLVLAVVGTAPIFAESTADSPESLTSISGQITYFDGGDPCGTPDQCAKCPDGDPGC